MKLPNVLTLLGGLAVLATANPIHALTITIGTSTLLPITTTFTGVGAIPPNGTILLPAYSEGGLTFSPATYANGSFDPQYEAPAGGSGNYLTVGISPQISPVTITFASPTNTLGFLWGSIDSYNSVRLNYTDSTFDTRTGTQIATQGGFLANATQARYVTFSEPTKVLSSVVLSSTNFAFETDNYSRGNVPEPSTLLQLSIGAAAILFGRRRFIK